MTPKILRMGILFNTCLVKNKFSASLSRGGRIAQCPSNDPLLSKRTVKKIKNSYVQ